MQFRGVVNYCHATYTERRTLKNGAVGCTAQVLVTVNKVYPQNGAFSATELGNIRS